MTRKKKNYPQLKTRKQVGALLRMESTTKDCGRLRRVASVSKGHLPTSLGEGSLVQFRRSLTRQTEKNGVGLCHGKTNQENY